MTAIREQFVPHGHEGASERLDLEIKSGESALLVVEVTLRAAETADAEKDVDYRQSVENHSGSQV